MGRHETEESIRVLKSLAFHIHKKESPADALTRCFEEEGRNGKHRKWRQPALVLEEEGFVPALLIGEVIGDEAACVLEVIEKSGDHRLLSTALSALAERLEHD